MSTLILILEGDEQAESKELMMADNVVRFPLGGTIIFKGEGAQHLKSPQEGVEVEIELTLDGEPT